MTQDALPSWLRTLYIAISDAPMTNIKTLNALVLVNGTAAFLVVAAFSQAKVDASLFDGWLIFLGSMLGISTLGMIGKRATYQPPNPPDAEEVAATTATPKPANVLTQADAQRAAEALEANQKLLADRDKP